jgi:hypothetical protein
MEKQNDSMRERLLARLPQPENLAVYREETAALLTKHEKALFWDRVPSVVCYAVAAIMVALSLWGKTTAGMHQYLWFLAGFAYFGGVNLDVRYRIYRSEVNTLKEVKQVQLQILELQASLQKQSHE